MADEVKNGLSADSSRIASKWNRNTVADGDWLQKYTLNPLTARDYYLASAIDALGSATDDDSSALSAAISSVSSIHDDYLNYLSATISNDYYSKSALSGAAGKNISITAAENEIKINTNDDVKFSSVSSTEFSGTNISALNFYIHSADVGAPFTSEISSNSTGISAHIVASTIDNVITASWDSIINAANNSNNYVPLNAEACKIGNNNSAYDNSFAQGEDNNAENQSLAQGQDNSAVNNSLTQGYHNSAKDYSIAQGQNNSAENNSIAQGYHNSAKKYSLAFGESSQAYDGGFAFSPNLWNTDTKPSTAAGNSFAFGNGCNAEENAFAMGDNCSAVNGGFAYGLNCSAGRNSIAIGAGMVSKERQISLGCYGVVQTANNNTVFHIGYGIGSADADRRDVFRVTSVGAIASYNANFPTSTAEVLLNGDFFQAPRYGRKIPMRLSEGISMATGINIDVKTFPTSFTARHNIIFGDDAEGYSFNMWIPDTTVSQEFTLTKAASIHRGVYRLTIGVDKNYSILFKNFNPNTTDVMNRTVIKTGITATGCSWPDGGTSANYDYENFFLDKESATSNTYFNFPVVPCDDIITFIVDGKTKQFIMIKGHS